MVLSRITLLPLAKELKQADSGLLSILYADDAVFDGFSRRSAQLLKLLMERRPDQGYFTGWKSPSSSWTHRGKMTGKEGIFGRGASIIIFQWELVPIGLSGT